MIELYNGDFRHLLSRRPYPLVIADPPYGRIVGEQWDAKVNSDDQVNWIKELSACLEQGGALYWWGGWGKYRDRILFEVLAAVERRTDMHVRALCPWVEKRAYGTSDNYLAALEFVAYLTKGPRAAKFNVPYLDQVRSCRSMNPEHPAKDDRLRRTMVWRDVEDEAVDFDDLIVRAIESAGVGVVVDKTEILRGKTHPTEKPVRVYEIPILVHTNENDWVLDPFGGSGVCAVAAAKNNRNATIAEINSEYYQGIKRRLDAEGIEYCEI